MDGCNAVQQSINSEVKDLMCMILDKANDLDKRCADKLAPVLMVELAGTCKTMEQKPAAPPRAYPPMFDGFRTLLYQIENAIDSINRTINGVRL
jgi:hypothetical protein